MQKNTSSAKLAMQAKSTRIGGYQNFLVEWKNMTVLNYCWLKVKEVQRLDPDIY